MGGAGVRQHGSQPGTTCRELCALGGPGSWILGKQHQEVFLPDFLLRTHVTPVGIIGSVRNNK